MKTRTYHVITGITLAAIAALAQACTDGKGAGTAIPKTTDPVYVTVMKPRVTHGETIIRTSGQITTDDETTLSFKTSGVVNSITVKEGDRIYKGQRLASLNLTEINAAVAQTHHALEKAKRDLQRVTNLYHDSVATLEQWQNAQTALDVATEQYQAAVFNRSYSEITATSDGYVLQKFANPGQVLGTGDPVLKVNGGAEGRWILKVGVSDKQWAAINVHDKATVTIDAFPGKTCEAFVLRKSETSDPRTGAFTIELQLVHENVRLASGMFGSANIHAGIPRRAWAVPYEAVLDADGNNGFLFITRDYKTAEKYPVTIDTFDADSIHLSTVAPEGSVIISGSAYLTDKTPIIIRK
jgi:RND family efflux transporter MFP subunit